MKKRTRLGAAWLLEQRKMADSWTAEETAQKQTKAERVLHDKKVLLAHREEAKARLAAANCPEYAITITGGE